MESSELKVEHSPAESFLSTPGELYPSLFGSPAVAPTMDPSEMLTPGSLHDDAVDLSLLSEVTATPATAPTPTGLTLPPSTAATTVTPPVNVVSAERRPAKKRKSWGQILPEPKTNLPPRKRAKTEDEKEQRRVERVLRNRRAAQSSRERKRLEVEALEQRNKQLEQQVLHFQKVAMLLTEELNKVRRNSGVVSRQNPVTFSQELFSSHDSSNPSTSSDAALSSLSALSADSKQSLMDELLLSAQSQTTVNPASISPAMSPAADNDMEDEQADGQDHKTQLLQQPQTDPKVVLDKAEDAHTSPDPTQHPAEMLSSDLQCRSAEVSRQTLTTTLAIYWQLTLLLTSTATILSVCQRPLTQIALSLKAGFSLAPTAPILNTIIWLVTRPSPSRRRRHRGLTSPSSTWRSLTPTTAPTTTYPPISRSLPSPVATSEPPSAAASAASAAEAASIRTPSTTLRLRYLRKILTCSPNLARPLSDATLAVLRLVQSEERCGVGRVNGRGQEPTPATAADAVRDPVAMADREGSLPGGSSGRIDGSISWLTGAALPSKEALITLLWAIQVEQRMISIRERATASGPRPGRFLPSITKIGMSSSPVPVSSHFLETGKYVLKVVHTSGGKRTQVEYGSLSDGTKRRRI